MRAQEKKERVCSMSTTGIGERDEKERMYVVYSYNWRARRERGNACVVLILLEREKSKRECVRCINTIGKREDKEELCVLY